MYQVMQAASGRESRRILCDFNMQSFPRALNDLGGSMKLRAFALAGVAVLGLSTAAQAGTGFYLGLGAGWTQLSKVRYQFPPAAPAGTINFRNSTRYLGDFGYKWDCGLRLEFEAAYSPYHAKSFTIFGGPTLPFGGHVQVSTFMVNALYDWPVWDDVALTFGAGAGDAHIATN